jgi:hypothetical protein
MTKVLKIINGVPRMVDMAASFYEVAYNVTNNISAGTPVTLPEGKSYNSTELSVFINGQKLVLMEDYDYVSVPPRTQVYFTFDLIPNDTITFKVE